MSVEVFEVECELIVVIVYEIVDLFEGLFSVEYGVGVVKKFEFLKYKDFVVYVMMWKIK